MKIFEIDSSSKHRQLAELIQKKCAPFLKQIPNLETDVLFRGVRGPNSSLNIFKGTCPVNRKPLDTPMYVQKVTDAWFLKKTGIQYRSNAIFCTGDDFVALTYGNLYVILPIGEFSFCYSSTMGDLASITGDLMQDPETPEGVAEISKILKNSNYKTTGLRAAIKSGSEVMVHCDEYYAMTVELYDEVIKYMNRGVIG